MAPLHALAAPLLRARAPLGFTAWGDRLAPFGVVDGDIVVVDAADTTPAGGAIVAARLNGRTLLAVYHRHGAAVTLTCAEGNRYLMFRVRPADDFAILGAYEGCSRSGRAGCPSTRSGPAPSSPSSRRPATLAPASRVGRRRSHAQEGPDGPCTRPAVEAAARRAAAREVEAQATREDAQGEPSREGDQAGEA